MHFVTADLDHGPIVAQAVVPVLAGDTEDTLAARVLAREHVLYPLAVRWFVEDLLRIEGGVVTALARRVAAARLIDRGAPGRGLRTMIG